MAGFRASSTVDVTRFAMKRYLQSSSSLSPQLSWVDHFCGISNDCLSEEKIKDVELVHLLLVCAEKICRQQFDHARILLDRCNYFSCKEGNSAERMVYYFSEALRLRLNRETGATSSKPVQGEEQLHPEEKMEKSKRAYIAGYQRLPFYQATLFAGMQAVIENVASAKRIHVIDLAIRLGSHYTVLMQALATRQECPVELLEITMVKTTSKQNLEDKGKMLAYFAETLNLPFSYKIVTLTDTKDLTEEIFEINEGEVVAVYSAVQLSCMVIKSNCLESLLKVLRDINPCVLVVNEFEANHNLQAFEERFFEALFHFCAVFDSLEVCMARSDPNRMIFEDMYPGLVLRNIIGNEGEERIFRHMKIDAWRDYFNRFGMVEAELSKSSLFQAELIVKKFACWSNSCTFDKNGECLIIGWKGIPHLSLSVWKFQQG